MGYIDFESESFHRARIHRALKGRGLILDPIEEWEIHGPHQGMNYQVYVGYAREGALRRAVAIYPKAVYSVGRLSDWWKAEPTDRIALKAKLAPEKGE